MYHYDMLKKLFPVKDMTGELDNDLAIEGKYLDQVDATASQLAREEFPDTATVLLSDWERTFDTTAVGDSARQAAIVAAERIVVNKDGRLNPNYYVSLAAGLGYDSTVVEGPPMFIVAFTSPTSIPPGPATLLPGQVYEPQVLWTWTLDSTGSTVATDRTNLMNLIIDRNPAYTRVNFNFI